MKSPFAKWRPAWLLVPAALLLLGGVFVVWRGQAPPAFNNRVLRWGGDASGGAPYLIDRGSGQGPSGFEADLADYLAGKLHVDNRFVQKYWDMLPEDLARGDIDVILNGYEWSAERERKMASTIPYYVYRLQLLVAGNSSIQGWDDLHPVRAGKRLKIGVLSDSAAHRFLERAYGDEVKIVALSEEGSTGVMGMVRQGKLDATVQDLPAAIYYVQQQHGYGDLKFVGPAVEPGYYVLFVRPSDGQLRDRLNAALRSGLEDGSLRRIYDKYGLWNADQEELLELSRHWPPPLPEEGQNLLEYAGLLVRAAGVTVALACLAMPLAIVAGLLVAVGRLYGPRWLDWLLTAYVEVLRGTPVLMQLFVIYYLLPRIGVTIDAFWAGLLGLAINYSAYEAENYRAGLLAIPRGQMEAALSLGMSTSTALRRIIVPQAVRLVIPPVTNDFISLFKDTSVCSVIAVVELTSRYRTLMVNHPQDMLEVAALTALLYLLMSYPLSLVARRLETRRAGGES
jgi:polar amino acid transport system substrate-binding protein